MLYPGCNREGLLWMLLPMTTVTAIVSPSALPSPRIIAPRIPDRPYGISTCQMVSQRVEPSARAASRWEFGMARKTSRVTAAMVGMIIMVRISPAARREEPLAGMGPVKKTPMNGTRPSVAPRKLPIGVTTWGRKTKMPHTPYTTLGIAARSSTSQLSGVRSQAGQSSARKMAIPTLMGTARRMATSEVINVP